MLLIKRYPNRKLYDTGAKRYISLDDVAWLVADGVEVTIRDAAKGDDLTSLTMAQIVMERERAAQGFLPRGLLFSLVQAGEEALHAARRLFPGTTCLREVMDEEIGRRVSRLVEQGAMSDEDGVRIGTLLLQVDVQVDGAGRTVDGRTDFAETDSGRRAPHSGLLDSLGVATRDDLAEILERLDELAEQIDALAGEQQVSPAREAIDSPGR